MLQRFGNDIVILLGHQCVSLAALSRRGVLLCMLAVAICKVHAQEPTENPDSADKAAPEASCLTTGDGYLRARLSGALSAELDWGNEGTQCTGAVRPTDGGIRLRFSRKSEAGDRPIVIVFGIADLREGKSARALPVNITLIREGTGEFYSTQGDDKCMLDEVRQHPVVGVPHRLRWYRVVARGFCTEPARSVRGKGAILLSRFDFAGRVDFASEEPVEDRTLTAKHP